MVNSWTLEADVPLQVNFTRRQKLLSRVALVMAAIIATYITIVSLLMPGVTPSKIIAVLAAASLAGVSWLSRRRRFYTVSAIAIVVISLLGGFGGSLSNGGHEGYVVPILITAPIAAALFLGARATLYSAAAVVLSYCLLVYLQQVGVVKPTPYSAEATSIGALVMLSTATIVCAAGLGYFAHDTESKIRSLTEAQGRLVKMTEELRHTALHDALTGVANRQQLQDYLDFVIREHKGPDTRICLVHIDLDKFKSINDTYGHPVGDGVLCKATRIMQRHCGDNDLVARTGGDEFIIVKLCDEHESAQETQSFCDRLIAQMSQPMFVNGVECCISASIGYVVSDTACSSVDSLIKNGDIALYEAKRNGRSVARRFTPLMRSQMENKRALISELESAFSEDRIACVLQPQTCILTGKLLGMEALGRVRTRERRLMTPGEFLDTLEEIGRLAEFDLQVMRKSLDYLVEIRARGLAVPHVSINASASSLRSSTYTQEICTALTDRGLSNDDVIVEILESILIEDENDLAVKTVEEMSEAGISTVMDDFGSGHASISSLLQLKVDGIKIDRSLIANIECGRSRQVVQAVMNLSSGLRLPAVVEGVETPRQHAILQSLGCEAAQGHGICAPLELAPFIEWLQAYGASGVTRLHERIRASGQA